MTGSYDPSLTEAFGTKKDPPNLVEGCPFISAKEIPKDGTLRTTWAGLPVTTTTPRFGGIRYYFRCPSCGRRANRLYYISWWKCRRCHRLTYQSQHAYVSRHPLLRSLQLIARLGVLEARYKAGDASAVKPLRKLIDRMWKELPRGRGRGRRIDGRPYGVGEAVR